jgi:PASTA domain-containing protein
LQVLRALLGIAAALLLAGPAQAEPSNVTFAPIGSNAYLVTLTNEGAETITAFGMEARELVPASIVPSPACQPSEGTPKVLFGVGAGMVCSISVAPGAAVQVCYEGGSLGELTAGQVFAVVRTVGGEELAIGGPAPEVAACPVAGFRATAGGGSGSTNGDDSGATTGGGSGTTTGGANPPTNGPAVAKKCVVPHIKGKKLAAAEKALLVARCKVGSVRKAGSKKVKKGLVISQSQSAGRSLASGARINLIVSEG